VNALAVAESPVLTDDAALMRRVLAWTVEAYPHERAEAVNALARAYLHCELQPEARAHAEIALTRTLDDPEPLVRRAMAEAFAGARQAPRHIVLTLARDISEVSRCVLAQSPLLGDADLVDGVGCGDAAAQTAIARRAGLSPAVAAALAEIGERAAVLALIGNVDADLSKPTLWRAFERFRDDPDARERLAERPRLPAAVRAALVAAATADVSADPPRRTARIARDGREQAFVAIAADASPDELPELVSWLRGAGHLTFALLLRALANGDIALTTASFADMANLPAARVAGWMRDPRGQGFAAIYTRAGLAPHLLGVFRIAVAFAAEAGGFGGGVNHALTMKMLRAIEALGEPELAPVVALLWRLVAEGARMDAREFVERELAAEAPYDELESLSEAPPVLLLNVEPSNENFAPPVELEPPGPVPDAA
jgi:uncharacterized protein (DUF2336 family)